jgi:branched-chain amino acid transport system substrate-binding protein
MTFRFALVFAGAALFLGSGIAIATAAADKPNAMQQRVIRAGNILGAATGCKEISRPRIKSVTDKVTEIIRVSAATEEEFATTLQIFERSVGEGQWSLGGGQSDCGMAERDLSSLEASTASVTTPPPAPAATVTIPMSPVATPVVTAPPAPAPAPAAAAQLAQLPLAGNAAAQIPSFAATAAAVRGVTDKEIRFGMSAPFSGSARELGRQMKLGVETAFNMINEAGGVNGRHLRLVTADDGYEPARVGETMKQLFEKEQVFGIVGNVGTPTAAVALPFSLQNKMLFYGAFTGAGLLRRDPPDRYVFNYRASYAEETDAVVHYLVKVKRIKPEQIAVFAQQDGYGDAGFAGVEKAMRTLRKADAPILRLNYQRNTIDVEEAIAQLRKQTMPQIKAIVMVATYRAAAKFIERTRDLYPSMVYTNVSFVGSSSLAEELKLLGPKYTNGIIVTQVVPAVEGFSSVVLDYKTALGKYFPGEAPDYVSLEGYVAAHVLAEAVKRAGPQVDTERLVDAFENLRNFDMGLGTYVNFGRGEHQGSHRVWGTELDANGKYQPIDLQ